MTAKQHWGFQMPRIETLELQEQLINLPDIEPLEVAKHLAGRNVDLYLCALGFEPRCVTLAEALAAAGVRANRVVYFEYQSNPLENDANRTALVSQLSTISASVESMDVDSPEFVHRVHSLFRDVSQRSQPPTVLIDISVFGNRLALTLYAALLDVRLDATLLYSEAAVYHPTYEEYTADPAKWRSDDECGLERGVSSISISPEHPGQFLDLLPDFVIVFPAFSPDRSSAAIEWVDPSLVTRPEGKVYWFVGCPHHLNDGWRTNGVMANHCIGDDTPHVKVSTFDYKECLQVLHSVCSQYGEQHNLTLVPLGSKLQALGAALCCYIHPEVRVLFAVPKEYNAKSYSEGTKALWRIGLGHTDELQRLLLQVGTLRIVGEGI